MKKLVLFTVLMVTGITMFAQSIVSGGRMERNDQKSASKPNRTSYGEFYSFTGWESSPEWESIRCLTHFTEHGEKVELPYSYLVEDPEAMGIGDLFTDITPGVLYNKDEGYGATNKLYRSMDYGYTWEVIEELSGSTDLYWTFKNAPGVLLKRNSNPAELRISYDYGSHFEHLDIPPFNCYSIAGWNVGEFFRQGVTSDWMRFIAHSTDYNQTADTVFYTEQESIKMATGADEGELYTYYSSYDPSFYTMSYSLFYSSDYGRINRLLMTIDSLVVGDVFVMDDWEFVADNEPGVFYSIKRQHSIVLADNGKMWIDYYRNYGDSLVTTYFHHFRPNWYSQHSPVMDCEIAGCDENSVTLRWNEPETRPDEVLVGYQVYRGENLISEDLVAGTGYTDYYSGTGRLKYHIIAVYSDGDVSKSYNIAYCDQTESVQEHDDIVWNSITLSPNPTSGIVRITGASVAEVQVYNTLGQLLKTVLSTNEISLEGLPQGVYTLRIADERGFVVTRKVVKE